MVQMKKPAVALTLIVALLCSTVASIGIISSTKANGIPYLPENLPMEQAYIRSNGDVDPSTLPIQRSDNIYVLKDNILNYSISIEKDNVVIDGNGFMLKTPAYGETDQYGYVKSANPLIQISNKSNIIIKNIIFDKFGTGIDIRGSSNIIIIQNTISNGRNGISMFWIVGNTLFGVLIQYSTFLNIAYNIISRNPYCGLELSDGQYSNINRNDFTDNEYIGLYLLGPNSNNHIFENNFINNEVGLDYHGDYNSAVNNTVNNNYWRNYRLQIDNYSADATSGVDQSPLASPISTSFDPSLFPLPPPSISVLSPQNIIFSTTDVPINFIVNLPTSWMGYSLDGQHNVTIAGNTTIAGLSNGLHTLTVYANDTAGNVGASETMLFTVPEPFPTTFIPATCGALAAVIGIGLFLYFNKRDRGRNS
jgi:parallel beta-helix repeat protein